MWLKIKLGQNGLGPKWNRLQPAQAPAHFLETTFAGGEREAQVGLASLGEMVIGQIRETAARQISFITQRFAQPGPHRRVDHARQIDVQQPTCLSILHHLLSLPLKRTSLWLIKSHSANLALHRNQRLGILTSAAA